MMSEAELHQLKQRMQAGARHKAERGELRLGLPVGLTRGPAGVVTLNPDEEVQARIRLVFEKFREIRSASGVMQYLRAAHLPLPACPRVGPAPNAGALATRSHLSHSRYPPQPSLCWGLCLWTQAV
jgi:DNA invertase Pin-like site-specific DNA recombinase